MTDIGLIIIHIQLAYEIIYIFGKRANIAKTQTA